MQDWALRNAQELHRVEFLQVGVAQEWGHL